jgi:hypothetical protein
MIYFWYGYDHFLVQTWSLYGTDMVTFWYRYDHFLIQIWSLSGTDIIIFWYRYDHFLVQIWSLASARNYVFLPFASVHILWHGTYRSGNKPSRLLSHIHTTTTPEKRTTFIILYWWHAVALLSLLHLETGARTCRLCSEVIRIKNIISYRWRHFTSRCW